MRFKYIYNDDDDGDGGYGGYSMINGYDLFFLL